MLYKFTMHNVPGEQRAQSESYLCLLVRDRREPSLVHVMLGLGLPSALQGISMVLPFGASMLYGVMISFGVASSL